MTAVVDYSYSHPKPSDIKNAGYIGAIRYLGWDFGSGPRCISVAEKNALLAAGLDYGLVWETNANMTLRDAAGGTIDGREANRQADIIGFPRNRPLFVAVDFDAYNSQLPIIKRYLDAFAAEGRPALIYGKYTVIEYFGDGWQCAAWSGNGNGSGGKIDGRAFSNKARLFQRAEGYVVGGTCDENYTFNDDWGQSGGAGVVIPEVPVAPVVDPVPNGTVQEVQADLTLISKHNNDASLDPHGIDGVWGPNTEAAVRAFQSSAKDSDGNPLVVDGIVGDKTLNSLRVITYLVGLENLPAVTPNLYPAFPGSSQLGSRGDHVRQVQRRLQDRGWKLSADASFGAQTDKVVRAFQADKGLVVDGVVGPETWKALWLAPVT